LVITETENLTQDFVGVLAEQRRTRHLGGLSDSLMGLPTDRYLPRVG
jgi:hypothetical protein